MNTTDVLSIIIWAEAICLLGLIIAYSVAKVQGKAFCRSFNNQVIRNQHLQDRIHELEDEIAGMEEVITRLKRL